MQPTPVVLLDRMGMSFYTGAQGRPLFPPDQYELRLVTSLDRLGDPANAEVTSLVAVSRHDPQALDEAARFQYFFGGVPATKILALTERMQVPAARIRQQLGVPGPTVEEMMVFRNKIAMKKHLQLAGVRVPDFAPYDRAVAIELLEEYGRVVIKPQAEAGSVDVHYINSVKDIDEFHSRFYDRLDEFEVEEFIDGELFHIDSLVQDSKVVAATAGHSIGATTAYRRPGGFCDIAVPAGPLLDRLLTFNQLVLSTHSKFTGVTHHEVFVTDREIVFCEIAARFGGGGIVPGFLARTGVHLAEAMVQAQTRGTVPTPAAISETLTGYTMLYSSAGTLRRPITIPDAPWILQANIYAKVDEQLAQPTAWEQAVAVVTVTGASETEVEHRLNAVIAETIIDVG